MPHSVTPEEASAPDQDTLIANAEPNNGETKTAEDMLTADIAINNEDSQFSEAMDQDMTMADAGVEGEEIPKVVVKAEEKPEVKLEDLFADMESDEEFPSSNIKDIKVSSSPEPPSSPV
jgi:DNA primase small subunit